MRYIGPAINGLIDFTVGRVRQLREADDRGAMFFRYGVPLLVAAMLAVAFTDVEDDVVNAVLTIVDAVRGTVTPSGNEG